MACNILLGDGDKVSGDEFAGLVPPYSFGHAIRDEESLETMNAADNNEKMEKVIRYIEKKCLGKADLKGAAKEVKLSPKYLSRIFKEKTGIGFVEYRLKIKIEKAKELLWDTNLSVGNIARMLGYKHPESFSRMFERSAGSTPLRYKKQIKGLS